jgi:uncharacterized protein
MSEAITISKKRPNSKAMDYTFLRQEGLKYIEQLASKLWTDYNVHDPGITMMEMLAYAVTDLGYRTNMPIENILATATDNYTNYREQFYTAREILPSRPVTLNDYRRLFIDMPEVTNVWLTKAVEKLYVDRKEATIGDTMPPQTHQPQEIVLNGIYNLKVEVNKAAFGKDDDDELSATNRKLLEERIRQVFHTNRNLCEDLNNILIVPEQKILICADIEITNDAVVEEVYAAMLYAIHEYLSPQVKQYSLAEMMERTKEDGSKYSIDEIFSGPSLLHGFITDEELARTNLRTTVYASDLISLIMDIKGVKAVRTLLLNYDLSDPIKYEAADTDSKIPIAEAKRREWCLPVNPGCKPVLSLDKLAFNFFKDIIPVSSGKEKALGIYRTRLAEAFERDNALKLLTLNLSTDEKGKLRSEDYTFPTGQYVDVDDYTQVMYHLPNTYGVSKSGLPGDASRERKALATQLKSYLLFFDQVLSNYLAQLTSAKELFRVRDISGTIGIDPLDSLRTYFYQPVASDADLKAAGLDQVMNDFSTFYTDGGVMDTLLREFDNAIDRKNRFLDHLLARFGENFNEYVLQLYSNFGQKTSRQIVMDKMKFLQDYEQISRDRSAAFNYYDKKLDVWNSDNISGIERRIGRLIGIPNVTRRTLSHIKWEIYKEKDAVADGKDEYRFRLTNPQTGKIVLSSSTKYTLAEECKKEFEIAMQLASDFNNYELGTTGNGKFFFNVVDQNKTVVARRIEYFDTVDKREKAINYLVDFVKTNFSDEGMFVVEHTLLREDLNWLKDNKTDEFKGYFMPVCVDDDCGDEGCGNDPYSFRVTVIMPGESLRFKDQEFRTYIEKVIRMETPAHIMPKICWLDKQSLAVFETAYQQWLKFKRDQDINSKEGQEVLRKMIEVLFNVKNIYPPGRLADSLDQASDAIILGKTNLGNLKN